MKLGLQLSPILDELELAILENSARKLKPCYPDSAIVAASQIFLDVLMDKMFNLQEKENMTLESRCDMAEKAGADLRRLIKTYTDLDSHDFYK